jgi:hypothetical protein
VAPVSHDIRESSDDFSDTIKKLLAGLEPRIASETIARAETLGKLPAAQQTLLRCALAAASETFKKAESLQEELVQVRELCGSSGVVQAFRARRSPGRRHQGRPGCRRSG